MHAPEWDYAHTDFAAPTDRPAPAGLAASESDWRSYLETQTPNGWLLRDNAMLQALTSGRPIYLMHTTRALDMIRTTGQLCASAGCLVGALYCAPLTVEAAGFRPHNLGAYLLETKPDAQPLVFEITPQTPIPLKGLDYLRLGGIHLRTYLTYRGVLTPIEDAELRSAAVEQVHASAGCLNVLLANAHGVATPSEEFIDQLAVTVPNLPFLGYLYFEVLSEYLLLYSMTPETKALAQAGEMNTRLTKALAFAAVASMGRLFDLALFGPDHHRLVDLVGQVEPGLAAGAAAYVRERLSHLFAALALAPHQDAGEVTFRGAGFDALARVAPHLLGHLIFQQMRRLPRYPQHFHVFEQAKALEVYAYWVANGIPAPFNARLPKGEIGVNPAHPGRVAVWAADVCERGLLHPVEQLNVAFVPRLTDLHLTALGRARFARTPR
ncbi:hypothetical protein ACQP1V_42820 (plasmid) [Microtetraspora malaysiensis]|uniref:hypothetical protein n=1 Tax=Microtetraspora malaysiensis TaxID=161358 RepID=UPI003D8CC008